MLHPYHVLPWTLDELMIYLQHVRKCYIQFCSYKKPISKPILVTLKKHEKELANQVQTDLSMDDNE